MPYMLGSGNVVAWRSIEFSAHESCERAFSLDPAICEIISRKIMGVITECKHTLLIVAVKRQAFDMAFICTLLFETNYCIDNTSSFNRDVWSAVRKTLSQALNRQTAFVRRVGFLRLCLAGKWEVIHDDCVRVCWCEITQNTFNGDNRLGLEPGSGVHVLSFYFSFSISLTLFLVDQTSSSSLWRGLTLHGLEPCTVINTNSQKAVCFSNWA